MAHKDSESLKPIPYGEQVARGFADGLYRRPSVYELPSLYETDEEEPEEEAPPWPKKNPHINKP